ncbi:MAG: hypothetical protein N2039_02605 [Gemmataceae bacterium]|nr:hypothetical protein [Gemmataceae bacterium]
MNRQRNIDFPWEAGELRRLVEQRTHHRIRDLSVEWEQDRGVILRGRAASYHVKQLAQHGILDVLPNVPLINAIEVGR